MSPVWFLNSNSNWISTLSLKSRSCCRALATISLSERLSAKDKALLDEVSAFSCNLNYKWITEKHIQYLKQHQYQIWCYTVNEAERFPHLDKVDAIFSDWPSRFI